MHAAPAVPLDRTALAARTGTLAPPAPVRMVHLGLGAFHRAHQAWFTEKADPEHAWGIAAFTGRNPAAAEELAQQDGLFHVLERSAQDESVHLVSSIVEAWDGARLDVLVRHLAASTTAVVTLTITEAGYRLTPDGAPDPGDPLVAADVRWLGDVLGAGEVDWSAQPGPVTTLGRLVAGLEARRRAGAGPVAVVPCDNMPDNGAFVRAGVLALARVVGEETARWVAGSVSFVSTSVDRITPATTPADIALVERLSGWADRSPVVCEPFADWVLSGQFPAGRPSWETAGARFVDDIEPFERRKLWLLNGAHTLLACAGQVRGHDSVAEAFADPVCRAWVEDLWDEAEGNLPADGLEVGAYRAALAVRFENERIEHRLAQIVKESVTKLRVRVAAVALLEREAGRPADGCARAVGAWVALVRRAARAGTGLPSDSAEADVRRALDAPEAEVSRRLVTLLDARLGDDAAFVAAVDAVARDLG